MSENNRLVGKGLLFLLIGTIIGLFLFIGGLFFLVGAGVSLYGLVLASKGRRGFQTALYCLGASVIVAAINFFADSCFLGMVETVLTFAVVFFVCINVSGLLRGIDNELADRGGIIWKFYAACAFISVICDLLIWLLPLIAGFFKILVVVAQMVASILYVIFLYHAQKNFRG